MHDFTRRLAALALTLSLALMASGPLLAGDPPSMRDLCLQGDARSCYELGLYSQKGVGGPVNLEKAREWYDLGCEGGERWACAFLGKMLKKGEGGPVDLDKARELLLKSCAPDRIAEMKEECGLAAFMVLSGDGGPEDPVEALRLFTALCDARLYVACEMAANMQSNSRHGVPQNQAASRVLYEKACTDGGSMSACAELASMLHAAIGGQADPSRARHFADKACSTGEQKGCATLGLLTWLGEGGDREQDKGWALMQAACETGCTDGCAYLALIVEQTGGDERLPEARSFLERSCDPAHQVECAKLGTWLVQGKGGAPDAARGLELWGVACEAGLFEPCYYLGAAFAKGKYGLAADQDKAAQLGRTACDGGIPAGCAVWGAALQTSSDPAVRDQAWPVLDKACIQGVVEICRFLGPACYNGDGRSKDLKAAKSYFLRGCELDDPAGCAFLAVMLAKGEGADKEGEKDLNGARQMFARACELGHAKACMDAGRMAAEGIGGDKAPKEGREHFMAACRLDIADGCAQVARMYQNGAVGDEGGVGADKAAAMHKKACDMGVAESCVANGLLWYTGERLKPSMDKALDAFRAACQRGRIDACALAGWVAFGLEMDDEAARQMEAGCADEAGTMKGASCFNLGSLNAYARKKPDEAIPWFRAACDAGFAAGCIQWAMLTMAKDEDTARNLADSAMDEATACCRERQDGECCLALADWNALEEPELSAELRSQGEMFLKKDCDAGKKGACRVLWLRKTSSGQPATP